MCAFGSQDLPRTPTLAGYLAKHLLFQATVRLAYTASFTEASFYAALGPNADQADVCKHVQQV